MKFELIIFLTCISVILGQLKKKFKPEDCEVCIGTIDKFRATIPSDISNSPDDIQEHFKGFCEKIKNSKEDRFCFYVGGKKDSATSVLNTLSKPLASSLPTSLICHKLYAADNQICDLRYDKVIDISTVDLNKLKVKDLKKIINDWDEDCKGCLEKSDYVKRINELKSAHVEL